MKNRSFVLLSGVVMGLVLSSSAFGFSLGDHKIIMLASIAEMNVCFPNLIDDSNTETLWKADLDEDTNIFLKDLLYSHYYNPEKPLRDLKRLDSSVRVARLSEQLPTSSTQVDDIGHLIHHIQDMGAPPHVVPVAHGLGDGFEEHTKVTGEIRSGFSCAEIKAFAHGDDYLKIHQATATETLRRVRVVPVPVIHHQPGQADIAEELSTTNFWWISPLEAFGKYGTFGNTFGQTEIRVGQNSYTVPNDYYQNYKREQLRLAVQGSIKALSVFYLQK